MGTYRVAHVITTLELGGAQKHALYVAGHLDRRQFESILISGGEGQLPLDARRLLAEQWICVPSLCRAVRPLKDLRAGWRLFCLLRLRKPHIVHTHSSKAGILGRWAAFLAGVPVIIHTVHGWSFTPAMPRVVQRLVMALERITAKITTVLVTVSQRDIEQGARCRIGRPEQYVLVRYGVEEAAPTSTGRQKREGRDEFDILAIACLKPQKNPQDIVRAASLLASRRPQIRWAIAGDGPLRPRVEALICRLRLEHCVTLLGWRRDVPELLQRTRVVVLTSRWEGMPLALLEAMAMARPVVAYDVNGISEVLHDGASGYLVPAGDFCRLAGRVSELLDNPALAERLGQAGRSAVKEQKYTASEMMAQLETVYKEKIIAKTALVIPAGT